MYDFGPRILKLRKERGLSQKDLAQKIGISNSSLGNYENDLGVPPLNVAEDLADAFNVSLRLTSLWITWYQGIRPKLLQLRD